MEEAVIAYFHEAAGQVAMKTVQTLTGLLLLGIFALGFGLI